MMKHLIAASVLVVAAHAAPKDARLSLADLPTVPAVPITECNGLVKFVPRTAFRPASADDLTKIMRFATENGRRVKAIGSMHSWSGVQAADDMVVLPQGLASLAIGRAADDGTLASGVDPVAERLVRAGAGTRLRDMNPELWKAGLALPNMGGWDAQTVGGGINTATHGAGLAYGTFCDIVRSIDLVVPDGRQLRIEPARGITDPAAYAARFPHRQLVQDDEVFDAALAGMGTMGVAHAYVLALAERFHLDEQRTLSTWEALKSGPLAGGGIYRLHATPSNPPVAGERFPAEHVEIAMNPYATNGGHTALVTTRKHVGQPADPAFKPGSKNVRYRIAHPEFTRPWLSETLLDVDVVPNVFGRLTREVLERFPGRAPGLLNTTLKTAQDDAFIDRSYFVFINGATEEICAFSEEIAVPVAGDRYIRATDALLAKAEEYRKQGWVQTGPFSQRFVRRTRALLAPQVEDVCMIDIIFLKGSRHAKEMARGYEDLLVSHEGRPHFGKLNSMTPERTRLLYGDRLARFNRVRRLLDPTGVMSNSGTDRMLGPP